MHTLTEHLSGRQSSLLTAEVVRGTCADMCPEKERYMREDRRRLSVYEVVPGTDLVRSSQLVLVER